MSMIKTSRGWRSLDGFAGEHPLVDLSVALPAEGDLAQESLSMADKDIRRNLRDVNELPAYIRRNLAKKPS